MIEPRQCPLSLTPLSVGKHEPTARTFILDDLETIFAPEGTSSFCRLFWLNQRNGLAKSAEFVLMAFVVARALLTGGSWARWSCWPG